MTLAARNWLIGLAAVLAMLPLHGAVAAPIRTLEVTERITIRGEPQAVWEKVRNFDALHTWHPGFSATEIIKGTNNKPGAVRRLTLKDGPSLTEELLRYEEDQRMLRYRIVQSPLPLNTYVSYVRVSAGPTSGTSTVTWYGTFRRKAQNPKPSETDEAVKKLVTGVYKAGLANLKMLVENPPRPKPPKAADATPPTPAAAAAPSAPPAPEAPASDPSTPESSASAPAPAAPASDAPATQAAPESAEAASPPASGAQ